VCEAEVCTIDHSKEHDKECQQYTEVRGVCVSFGMAVSTFAGEKNLKSCIYGKIVSFVSEDSNIQSPP
jgi:hypothetical protein